MATNKALPKKYSKEGLYFEAKSASEGIPSDFWETYSAFANTFGGKIVLGISERKDKSLYATGVQNVDKTIQTLWDNLNNPRFVNYNLLTVDDVKIIDFDGINLLEINVPMADRRKRPIYIRNNINSGTFKRNNEGDYHCRIDEIKEMIRDSEDTSQDNKVIEDLGIDCFEDSSLTRFLTEISSIRPGHPWVRIEREEFLERSGAGVKIDGVLRPTLAGLLMFGKVSCIRRVLNGYFLDYREKTTSDRWDMRIHSNSGDWSGNIYDFVSEVMTRLSLKIGSRFEIKGYTNNNGSDTFIAVREAVLNGVIHADYNLNGGISIQWSSEKVIVTNPGTMRIPINEAKKGGRSDPRNNTLMAMAMAIGWVERIGSGIYVMENAASEGKLLSVTIKEESDPSAVRTILELPVENSINVNANKIISILRDNPNLSRREIAEELGMSLSTVSNCIVSLKIAGRIKRVGSNKYGHWVVIQ